MGISTSRIAVPCLAVDVKGLGAEFLAAACLPVSTACLIFQVIARQKLMGFPQPAFATTVEISPFFFPFLETIKGAVRKGPQGGINQGSSATNSAIGTPCSSITYRSAMPDILILPITNGCYHAAPTVSDRVSRLSTGLASRLAYDLNSFMILSGRRSASTIICTWLDLTCAASRFHPR